MRLINNEEYVSWFSYLFHEHAYKWVFSVSIVSSLAVFLLGYGIARLGGLNYLQLPAYVGLFAVFGMTAALGIADSIYTDVWNEARQAFDVDDETYLTVVRPRLERIHDERRIFSYTTTLAVPYFFVVIVAYLPLYLSFRDHAIEIFLGGTLSYKPGIFTVILICLFGAVSALLIATIVNGFIEHLALVREVSELPFRDIHVSASELAPIARFSVASATAWFAGISLIILWMQAGIGGTIGTAFIVLLVVTGLLFFSAPQLILHDALVDAKRKELNEVRREYEKMLRQTREDSVSADTLSQWLELTDRRLEHAKSINTWVFDMSSISKFAAASIIPWLKLVQEIESVLEFV